MLEAVEMNEYDNKGGNRRSIYVNTINKDNIETSFDMEGLSAEFRHRLGILPEEEQELSDIFRDKLGLQPVDNDRLVSLICNKKKTLAQYPISHFTNKYFQNPSVENISYIDKPLTAPLLAKHNILDTQASIYILAVINNFINQPSNISQHNKQPYESVMMRIQNMMTSFSSLPDHKPHPHQNTNKTKKFSIKKLMQKTIGKAYSKKSSAHLPPPPPPPLSPPTSPSFSPSSSSLSPSSSSSFNPFSNKNKKTYESLIEGLEDELEMVQFIVGHGIIRPELRDEIFCQLCCQASKGDSPHVRVWVLHSLCVSCFLPSLQFIPYYISFLHDNIYINNNNNTDNNNNNTDNNKNNTDNNIDNNNNIDRIFQNMMKTNDNGFRYHPTNSLELKSELTGKDIEARVKLVDGRFVNISLNSSTTAMDVCQDVCKQIDLEDFFGFSLYLSILNRTSSLGCGSDHIMDAITECEHMYKDSIKKENIKDYSKQYDVRPWQMTFRKELFTPWYDANLDDVSSRLVLEQIKEGLLSNELRCPFAILSTILCQLLYVEGGAIDDVTVEERLMKLVHASVLQDGGMELMKEVCVVSKRMGLDENNKDRKQIRYNLLTTASKIFCMSFSALFEAYNHKGFDGLDNDNVIIALNGQGLYVLDSNVAFVLAQFKFSDLLYTHSVSTTPNTPPTLSIVAVDGYEYNLISPNSEVVSKIIQAFLNGLRRRSSWAIAVKPYIIQDFRQSKRFSTLDTKSQSFELKTGDIIELTDESTNNKEDDKQQLLYGRCERSGLCGFFPPEAAYVIATTSRPSQEYLDSLRLVSEELTQQTQTLVKKSRLIMYQTETIKEEADSSV